MYRLNSTLYRLFHSFPPILAHIHYHCSTSPKPLFLLSIPSDLSWCPLPPMLPQPVFNLGTISAECKSLIMVVATTTLGLAVLVGGGEQ